MIIPIPFENLKQRIKYYTLPKKSGIIEEYDIQTITISTNLDDILNNFYKDKYLYFSSLEDAKKFVEEHIKK
jgi:hypothetical protein